MDFELRTLDLRVQALNLELLTYDSGLWAQCYNPQKRAEQTARPTRKGWSMASQDTANHAGSILPPDLEIPADEFYMALAVEEAREAKKEGEVPVGCVIESGGWVIAGAHNRPIALHDSTAHAEMLALREAGRRFGNYRLSGATLYVTIEPCLMCVGGILQARLKRLVYGAADEKAGAVDSLFHLASDPRLNHQVEVSRGVLEDQCRGLMKNFFAGKRS